jgi:hypothetical protein
LQKKVTLLTHFRSYLLAGENEEKKNSINNNNNNYNLSSIDKFNIDFNNTNLPKSMKSSSIVNKHLTCGSNFVYVKKWMRTKHAILFRLSNKTIQICFLDKTEIHLNSDTREVIYISKLNQKTRYPLNTALDSTNLEMVKRLKYVKEVLTHMLNNNNTNINTNSNSNGNNQNKYNNYNFYSNNNNYNNYNDENVNPNTLINVNIHNEELNFNKLNIN